MTISCPACSADTPDNYVRCQSCGHFVLPFRPSSAPAAQNRAITISALAFVLCAVSLFAFWVFGFVAEGNKQAARSRTTNQLLTIYPVAAKWRVEHPGKCPTLEILYAEKELARSGVHNEDLDGWENPIVIECGPDEIFVVSAGPDHKRGTRDDLQIPSSE